MRETIFVPLSDQEEAFGRSNGMWLWEKSIREKRRMRAEGTRRLANDIMGAWGELALAKWTNTYITSLTDKTLPDVGNRWEVRASTYRYGGLILYRTDHVEKPHCPFVLAIIWGVDGDIDELPREPFETFGVELIGWCWTSEGCVPRFDAKGILKTENTYLVPQSSLRGVLRDMRTLPYLSTSVPDLVRGNGDNSAIHSTAQPGLF